MDVDAAAEAYRKAVALYQQLAADFPAVPEYRHGLALGHYRLGGLFQETWRAPEAYSVGLMKTMGRSGSTWRMTWA